MLARKKTCIALLKTLARPINQRTFKQTKQENKATKTNKQTNKQTKKNRKMEKTRKQKKQLQAVDQYIYLAILETVL